MNPKLTNYILIGQALLIVILAIGLTVIWRQNKGNSDDFKAYKIAMSNDFKTFTDKNGHEIAQVQAAVFDKDADFKSAVEDLNKNGANIQSKIDNNTQGLILLQKKVGGQLTGSTKVVKLDTVQGDSLKAKNGKDSIGLKVYPVYAIDTTTKWYEISGTVGYKKFTLTPLFYDSTET